MCDDNARNLCIRCKDVVDAARQRQPVFDGSIRTTDVGDLFDLDGCTPLISGTAFTISSPSSAPDLYSARLVVVAPLPAIVPPLDSTQTSALFAAGIL